MSVLSNLASSTPAETSAYVSALLGLLGDKDPLAVLSDTPGLLQRYLVTMPATLVRKPEAPGKWSTAEVFQHLADSDLVGGFRMRMILAHDRPPLMGYDQDLWADRLCYRDADVNEAFDQFTALRRANLRLWQRLGPSDLLRVGVHSERGEESLGHLLRLYAGHDLLHLNQLTRIRAAVVREGGAM